MSEEGQSTEFSRSPPREAWTKAFAVDSERTRGHANKMLMNNYPEYKAAAQTYQTCMMYAHSYANTMVLRVLEEQPDFFEDKNITKTEFVAHVENNLCLGQSKYRAKVMKDTTAKIQEDGYLTDKIRRLANGGDKFHPYL